MAGEAFSISFDPGSLATLARLAGFAALMEPAMVNMLAATGTLLVTAAQDNTWKVFDNPTGTLADSIVFMVVSPEEIALEVGVPYGARREYGFEGKVDSLGRVGRDKARPYLQPAIDDNQDLIRAIMADETMKVLGVM
jgi:hypothetical protein